MGNSYVKVKVRNFVISFMYPINGKYIQRQISVSPDKTYNSKYNKDYNYYYNYGGEWYTFDGDYEGLDKILKEFKPTSDPRFVQHSIKGLLDDLHCKFDLQKYYSTWSCITGWASTVVTTCLKIPVALIKLVFCPGNGTLAITQ